MKQKTILQITGMTSTKYGEYERFLIDLTELCNNLKYRSILQYESLPHSKAYLKDLGNLSAEVIIYSVNTNPITSCWNVVRLIAKARPEIIHTHFVERYGLFFIPILGRIFGAKKIITTVNYKRWGGNKYLRFAYNMYDHVLPCSIAVKDDLITRGTSPKNVNVQYLGITGEHKISAELRSRLRKEFGIPIQAVTVACIAFDTEFKGLDILLKAFGKIAQKHNDLHLISIGVDPNQSKLPELAKQFGLSQRIHWAGIVDEGWKILNAADIYIQPSRFGEGLSLSILEAMSMKLPVVCTKVAGNGEAVIDGFNGILAAPNDTENLANALDRLISQRSKWTELGEAGYKRYLNLFQGKKLREELVNKYYK